MPPQDHPQGVRNPSGSAVTGFLAEAAVLTEQALDHILPPSDVTPTRLHAAMRYSVFAGGRRLRPALVLAAGRACGAVDERCAPGMAAVELLHTYTLIHDDLPAMDDDDLRRGRATCHRAFDEATAILAGDALQALAFASVSDLGLDAVRCLAAAAGSRGVVGGQQEDLEAEGQPIDTSPACKNRLEAIHRAKTAALIACACELGGLAAGAGGTERAALRAFGTSAGLAFQIADDVLDASASSAALGKTAGKDAAQGKLTYVAVHGLAQARQHAAHHLADALAHLAPLAARAEPLAGLARFMVHRDH